MIDRLTGALRPDSCIRTGPMPDTLAVVTGRQLNVEGYEGKVVAIDRVSDEVVAAADTPEELMAIIRSRHLVNTMVVRVPRVDEPLRVGLG